MPRSPTQRMLSLCMWSRQRRWAACPSPLSLRSRPLPSLFCCYPQGEFLFLSPSCLIAILLLLLLLLSVSVSVSLWFVQPTFGLWREVTFVDIVVAVPREELQGAGTLVRYVGRVSSLPNFYGADALTASQVPRLLLFLFLFLKPLFLPYPSKSTLFLPFASIPTLFFYASKSMSSE